MFAMVVMATAIIASMTVPTAVFALGHFNEPSESNAFDGPPTNDLASGSEEDEDHSSGYDTFPGGPNNAISGFPNEEMSSGSVPEQGGEGNADTLADNAEDADGVSDNVDADATSYKELQGCLSNAGGDGSPTEQEVQGCLESSYGGEDNVAPVDSSEDNDENGDTQDVSADNVEEDEDEDSEE